MNASGIQAYKKTQVQTADQGTLILMCYEGTITFLKKGKIAMQSKAIEDATIYLNKAQNVLWELTNSLNFNAGEIAYNLESLYNYMIRRIVDAQYHDNAEALDEVVGHMEELKGAWETIIHKKK